ncbi:MAG: carbonic anhydrase family protein [Cyanobacteria bacterium J06592_8]
MINLVTQAQTNEWGYKSQNGPKKWGELNPEFILCKSGKEQSPINIESTIKAKEKIEFNYGYTPLKVINNSHTVEIVYESGSQIKIEGKIYKLRQFHFHSPSEHHLNGKSYPMEVHLVHENSEGQLTVIGILMKEGKENEFIKSLWVHAPEQNQENIISGVTINASALPPEDQTYYNYTGSLTTPPCSENVNWIVFQKPIEVSRQQIKAFQTLYNGNARPIQPLNDRQVF